MKKYAMYLAVVFSLFNAVQVMAQSFGHDMWTGDIDTHGLWKPHLNNCSGSEVFVPVGQSSDLGFCIEVDERTAAEFNDARQTCIGLGKRLPETVEWTQACLNGGCNDMTGGWEWSSNFPFMAKDYSDGSNGLHAMVSGYVNCRHSNVAEVFAQNHQAATFAFRCVH